jgi:hypothetical protein
MILVIRKPRRRWPLEILAWLSGAFSIFSAEYFFGMELLRPVSCGSFMVNRLFHGKNGPNAPCESLASLPAYPPLLPILASIHLQVSHLRPRLAQTVETDPRTTIVRAYPDNHPGRFGYHGFCLDPDIGFREDHRSSSHRRWTRWGLILVFAIAIAYYLYHLENDGTVTDNNNASWACRRS